MSGDRHTAPAGEYEALAARALEASGTAAPAARSVAAALIRAELDGLPSHGLARVPAYSGQVRTGKVRGDAEPTVTLLGASGARVDAADGFAYPAFDLAIDTLTEVMGASPVGAAAITNSHHFGVAGHHVERLADRGFVGLVFGNSPAAIAPWGGRDKLFGTNPIAFGFPRAGVPPVVVDLSLSKQARGKVMLAAREGRPIPDDWALDAEGNPTTDADAALGGSMVPMGDAKGAALVFAVEVMAAALTGANFGFEASSFFTDEGEPPRVGQLLIAFDPGPFSGGGFDDRLGALLEAITAQEGTRLPGARRLAARGEIGAAGISIAADLHATLEELAGA
jgi:(2R)-3-sulfolactate dehydrogenase (NADP+)